MGSMSFVNHLYTVGKPAQRRRRAPYRVKNRVFDATVTSIGHIVIDGVPCDRATTQIAVGDVVRTLDSITPADPLPFSLRTEMEVRRDRPSLTEGAHSIRSSSPAIPSARSPSRSSTTSCSRRPTDPTSLGQDDDWSEAAVRRRQEFVREVTGVTLEHVAAMSYDPSLTRGNIEHLTGTVQLPLGVAGPLRVNGEHAQGEFLIPLATSEGTLVPRTTAG